MVKIFEKFKLPLIFILIGLILIGGGVLLFRFLQTDSPQVEIISTQPEKTTVWVDLEGAVEKPGVYELTGDSRINDLLIKAGGLSSSADRDWVGKNLNLAQKLTDGIKIFIPNQSERVKEPESKSVVAGATSMININTATITQLDSLWGIGDKRAQDIVTNRPYQAIEELVSRKIIPQSVFDKIKGQITIY